MKKHLMFALLASLSLTLLPGCKKDESKAAPAPTSNEQESTTPAPAAPASEAEVSTPAAPAPSSTPYLDAVKESIICLDTINKALATVTDKASADAAAEHIAPTCERMKTLMKKMPTITPASPAERARVQRLQPEFMKQFGDMINKAGTMSPDYYGSEALKTILEAS